MNVYDIAETRRGEAATLQAQVIPAAAAAGMTLWFRYYGLDAPLNPVADPFVAAMLPSCMLDSEALHIDGILSAQFRRNLPLAQAILSDWYPWLAPVRIDATECAEGKVAAPGVACCFSGGADSWYSLLKNSDRITHLLLVRGFDIGLDNDRLWDAACRQVEHVAERLNKRVILCETNLREIADRRRAKWGEPFDGDFWGRCLHGAALAACALALHRTVGEIIVPATHTYNGLKPWGSSPMLDRYWSNGRVLVAHDGCEANRLEKIRELSRSRTALRTLRVCHYDTVEANCGSCEKCLRTMIALHLCNALDRAETLPDAGAFAKLRRLDVPDHVLHHYRIMLDEARRNGDRAMARSIQIILGERFSSERTAARIVRRIRRLRSSRRPSARTLAISHTAPPGLRGAD